jgi:predicted neutral ceramidase superfamily lipid hydrolase
MPTVRHNHAAIIVATLVYFFLGAAWFTTFMNPWLAGIGRTMAELKNSGVPPWLGYVVALIMTAILAIALSWIIQATGPQTATRGATIAAALWLGFVFSTWATEYAFEARSISILAINTGYPLVGMLLMGLVLGGWKSKPRAS